jgi:hypothetical protein
MSQHESPGRYATPQVVDYGTLVEITAAPHLLLGATGIHDLTFSSPNTPGSGGELPGTSHGSVVDGVDSPSGGTLNATFDPGAGGTSGTGGTAGGSSSGAHGQLPFTGVEAGAIAAVGSGLAAAGGALRRKVRRRT